MKLEFTQFLRPNGERRTVHTDVDDRYSDKVKIILDNDFRFEMEELTTGHIHMTITDELADYSNFICDNNEEVPTNIEAMIDTFNLNEALDQRTKLQEN